MSNKLQDRYAIQPNILLLRSLDGKPVRLVYPTWSIIYPSSFKDSWETYVHGKIDPRTGKRSEKNCHTHVMNILDRTFKPIVDNPHKDKVEQEWANIYTKIHDLISPVPFNGKLKNPRLIKAYGMYSALSCGMTLNFEKIIKEVEIISENMYTNTSYAKAKANLLCLKLEQTNFIASMITAPAQTSATCVNAVRGLTMNDKQISQLPAQIQPVVREMGRELREKIKNPNVIKALQGLTEQQQKEIINHIDNVTKNAVNHIQGNIKTATDIVNRGNFLMAESHEMVKLAVIDNVLDNLALSLSKLPQSGRIEPRTLISTIGTSITKSFNHMEEVAKVGEYTIDDKRAATITENALEGKQEVRLTTERTYEVAEYYTTFTDNVSESGATNY